MPEPLKTWVTYALDDAQVIQALVLGQSLRRVLTKWRIIVFTNNSISAINRTALETVFDGVMVPDGMGQQNGISDELYCKLYCWKLFLVQRCIFIQPDSLVVNNCDEIMEGSRFLVGQCDNNQMDDSIFACEPSFTTFQALLKICRSNKINMDISKVFELHFGKTSKGFQGVFLSMHVKATLPSLEMTKVPIVRLRGGFTSDVVEIKSELSLDNLFAKILQRKWITIFNEDVQPLLNEVSKDRVLSIQRPMKMCPSLEPIAIIGMGCRLPGANNLEEFWQLLIEGGDGITSPSQDRLPPAVSVDLAKNMKAGFLKCPINEFDGKFFGVSPKELSFLDPQTRILLEVLWEALEDAAVDPLSLKGTNAGIFTGAWTQDYKELLNKNSKPTEDFFRKYMGNSFGACAGRLSFILGINGPNIATESGCSSSMIGLDIACNKLRLGETQLAMACGVNLVLHHFSSHDMDAICAKDGHCKTFDASADGFGRAEGCGVLILKTYSQAIKDGDRIHALVRGMGAAQEGSSRSLGTPTIACEASAMKKALKNAGVEPWEVSYVESHGTGTPVGDPMEMSAIAEAYRSEQRIGRLIVGSVKTNVGHTESCSGITGIIKTVLSLHNEMIPPHLNFTTLNDNVDLDAVPASIPLIAVPWKRQQEKTRYAGVSSFGITGTDAHAIIQEAPEPHPMKTLNFGLIRPQHVLTLSAKSELALEALLNKYKQQFLASKTINVGDAAFTANTGRAHFIHRAAIVGKTLPELAKNIEKKAFIQGKVDEEGQKICFLFTGQGSQYLGMGQSLYETSPEFRFHFDTCDSILTQTFGISIRPVLWPKKGETLEQNKINISRTIYSQTSIFCIEYCLLKLWESWGVKPDYVLGHSLGEFAAATASGILSLQDALTLVAERSRLIDNLPGGRMIVLREDKARVEHLLMEFYQDDYSINNKLWLDFAAINSNEQTVLAGETFAVEKFEEFCKKKGTKCITLEATHAFHSRHMNPMLEEYGKIASKIKYQPPTCKFVSGVDGKVTEVDEVNANYWIRHTRESVEFKKACKAAWEEGCRLFLEIGPQPILSALTVANSSEFETKNTINASSMCCLPSLRRNADEWTTMLSTLSKLYVSGVPINWKNFDQFYCRKKVSLPTYPFQRKKFWFDSKSGFGQFQLMGTEMHPLIGCVIPNATSSTIYHVDLDLNKISYVKDHVIGDTVIYPGAGYLEMGMASGYSTTQGLTSKFEFPSSPISFENLLIEAPLQLLETEGSPVQIVVSPDESSGSLVSIHRKINIGDGNPTNKWIRHASGKYFPFALDYQEESRYLTEDLSNILKRIHTEKNLDNYYSALDNVGLKFGPSFKSVKKAWSNKDLGEFIAEILVPTDYLEYLCHPVIIDSMIQSIIANTSEDGDQLKVPIRIEKFIWFSKIDTDSVYAHSFPKSGTTEPRSVALYNSHGKLLALMTGAIMLETSISSVQNALKSQQVMLPSMYEEIWKRRPGPLEDRVDMIQTFGNEILSPDFVKSLLHFNDEMEVDQLLFPHLNNLCFLYVQKALYNLGWSPTLGEEIQVLTFCERFSIRPSLQRFVNRLFMILGEEGYLSGVQDQLGQFISWNVTSLPPAEADISYRIKKTKRILKQGTSQVYGSTDIVVVCGDKLSDVLQGRVSPVDLLFANTNETTGESLAETFYSTSTLAKYKFQPPVIRKLLEAIVNKYTEMPDQARGVLQILEVGAGTGTLTKMILPILEELKLPYQYTYTDISAGFFMKAEKVFEPYAKKMTYKVFDLEKDPFDQGFSPGQFDFIVNVNVLHICKSLSQCLRNLRQLTVDGGLVYVSETTQPYREIDLVFGLFEAYWMYEDIETRTNHCLLSGEQWMNLFNVSGYDSITTVPAHCNRGGVMIGRASKIRPAYFSKQLQTRPKSWIIFSGTKTTNTEIFLSKLQNCGRSVILIKKSSKYNKISDSIYEICPHEKSEMVLALSEITNRSPSIEGIIYFWGDDEFETDQKQISEPLLYLSQVVGSGRFKPLPKIFILTSGMIQTGDDLVSNPSASTLWGLVRTLRMEISTLYCKCIDMDNIDSNNLNERRLEQAFREMWKTDGEFQIAYRQNRRYVTRLTTCKVKALPLTLPNSEKCSLALPTSKVINDIRIISNSTNILKEDEVDVEVRVTALNFKDVLIILKPIKEFEDMNSVGFDFSGIVTRIGSNVTDKKVGDRVFGCNFEGGAMPSHVIADSKALVPIPNHWTYSEAATLPVVFATAYYCMVTVADLKPNETILIHAASGGVGLVAIQLAKHIGANIIATAGNPRKRTFLRNLGIQHIFNSRTLEYEQQIKNVTNGRGVDMVLNCLTGPGFKEASLNLCASGARFVEMSKIDVWNQEDVETRRPDVNYTLVDLTHVAKETWTILLNKMYEFMNTNIIHPIPYTAFDLVHVREALNYLQKAKHIGKVVVQFPSRININGKIEAKFNLFNEHSSYLITGGLGGIGLEVAKWMADSGARHLILVGRSLPGSKATETIESLCKNGVNVVTLQADVGDFGQCQLLLEKIKDPALGLPTLRGIMHAAGTLSDALLDNQSWSNFNSTFNPKVNGGWNLHILTKDYSLEHFVMFSSVVALVGNLGQANHAAGNAFLDTLAFHRTSIGLPALTVNWGQWGEVGVAKEMKVNGFRPFSPKEGLLALEMMMKSHKPQGCVFEIQFGIFRKIAPNITQYLEEVRSLENADSHSLNLTIDTKAFREEFDKASNEETNVNSKLEVVKKYVEIIIRQILKLDSDDEVDPNQNLSDMGLDSLMMVEMKNSIQLLIGNHHVLNPKDLQDCQTLQLISQHITKLLLSESENAEGGTSIVAKD